MGAQTSVASVPAHGDRGCASSAATRTTAPGRLATNTITPYTTAVATPSDAPSPAAANAQAVTPSRGPQPPTLGSAAACITSSASGSTWDSGAVTPALRAAIRNVAAWPATTSADASAMAGHARRASSPSRRSRAAALRSRAHRDRPAAGARAPPARGPRHRDERERDERHDRLHRRRQDQEYGDGEDDLHDLPGRALPRHGAQPAADVARVTAVAEPAVDVAHHPAGQCDVEEERAVVRGHRRTQRQVDAEAAGHDPPAPGGAHGGQHGQARRGRQRPAVDRAQAVEEGAGSQAPDQDGERRGGDGDVCQVDRAADVTAAPAGRRGRR